MHGMSRADDEAKGQQPEAVRPDAAVRRDDEASALKRTVLRGALVEACELNGDIDDELARLYGSALETLVAAGATASEVRVRARRFRSMVRDRVLDPATLVQHWEELANPIHRAPSPDGEPEPDWQDNVRRIREIREAMGKVAP